MQRLQKPSEETSSACARMDGVKLQRLQQLLSLLLLDMEADNALWCCYRLTMEEDVGGLS
eukprot:m.96429 g.96429  ORF g.96429 m.96429 type:complete len:60 (+) comp14792_c0_seq6:1681-1860(+)